MFKSWPNSLFYQTNNKILLLCSSPTRFGYWSYLSFLECVWIAKLVVCQLFDLPHWEIFFYRELYVLFSVKLTIIKLQGRISRQSMAGVPLSHTVINGTFLLGIGGNRYRHCIWCISIIWCSYTKTSHFNLKIYHT